jgi:hypothetical protein
MATITLRQAEELCTVKLQEELAKVGGKMFYLKKWQKLLEKDWEEWCEVLELTVRANIARRLVNEPENRKSDVK